MKGSGYAVSIEPFEEGPHFGLGREFDMTVRVTICSACPAERRISALRASSVVLGSTVTVTLPAPALPASG